MYQPDLKEKWSKLSLTEQLGNIGSEINRALLWRGKDNVVFNHAVDRALELFDFTLDDARWKGRLKEVARVREIFCDIVFGGETYHSSLRDLVRYCDQFAYAARLHL